MASSRSRATGRSITLVPPRAFVRRAFVCVRDEKASETPHLALRQAGADQHSVLQILALVDRRAERVELGELPAILVRQQAAERPRTGRRIGRRSFPRSSSRPSPVTAEICDRAGKAVRQPLAAQRIDAVDLVQHELERHLVRPDLVQDGVHRVDHLLQPVVASPTHRRRAGRDPRRESPPASRRSPRRAGSAGGG